MRYYTLAIFLLCGLGLSSQCDGNLGENIFEDGDFGEGVPNIMAMNPNFAPGYDYSYAPPPNDGDYTITNNTTTWGSFAANWANIGDNSDNPNGYMMVVNASYDPGLFYEQKVTGLCEDTEFEFSADIYNLILGANNVILPNVSFLIDGNIVFETGDVPGNGEWNTYAFTFATEPGQTEVTLALQNNAPGGAGNDLALDNISFSACGPKAEILPETIANICEDGDPIEIAATITGDQYDNPTLQWQTSTDEGASWVNIPGATNLTYTHTDLEAGYYYYRYLLANGGPNLGNSKCRVNSNIKIIYVQPKSYQIIDTICAGLSIVIKDQPYTESGVYSDSLISRIGCDSIVTLNLTVVTDPNIEATVTPSDPSCHYRDDGSIDVSNIQNAYLPYSIFINEAMISDFPLGGLPDGIYTLMIRDRHGCLKEQVITLSDPPVFVLDLGTDLEVDLGEEVTLTPTTSEPAHNYQLQGGGEVNCDADCSSISWLPTSSQSVILSANSIENDCTATDTVSIIVTKSRKIYFPNVFSPDGNGINDSFLIKGSRPNVARLSSVQIYDRWGGLVYSSTDTAINDQNLAWDGKKGGQVVANGVYGYRVTVLFLDGEEVDYLGTVTVIR